MKYQQWLTASALAVLALSLTAGNGLAQQQAKKAKPRVEVMFVIDTTGSMGGLINAAKQKVWAICNQIAGGKPTPEVRVGLIAYRDRGDQYVTKVFDLTDDLDAIHGHLMGFQAAGGGDFPESVNQALHEAVTKVKWSQDKKALKIIFLVGDAPPKHYADDVPYEQTCQLAAKNGIIINSIQCGSHGATQEHWRKICQLSEGSYVQIDAQGGPIVTVSTPYDKELAGINSDLAKSTLTYGGGTFRKEADAKKDAAMKLAPPAAAARAGFSGKSGTAAAYDLLDSIKSGKVKLEALKTTELPTELQKLNLAEQKSYLIKVDAKRIELQKRAVDLDKKRNSYIQEKLKEQGNSKARDAFDQQVLNILQQQARRVNIQYATEPKSKNEKK